MRRWLAILIVALAFGAVSGIAAYHKVSAQERSAAAHWQEIAWPYPRDAWPAGRAFRCDASSCGGAVEVYLSSHFSGFPNGVPPPGLYHRILREIEVPLLTAALAATRGNQIRAADLLGLNRNTLRKKIRDLDIQVYRTGS